MQHSPNDKDWLLLHKLQGNDSGALQAFYAKYASLMFGCTLDICKQEGLASGIFKKIFLNLRTIQTLRSHSPFAFWLWQHTGSETKRLLKEITLERSTADSNEAIIEFMCFNKVSREEVAQHLAISNEEIGRRLKHDLNHFN